MHAAVKEPENKEKIADKKADYYDYYYYWVCQRQGAQKARKPIGVHPSYKIHTITYKATKYNKHLTT